MKTHVFIGTTEAPVAIQRITEEDTGVQSVICLNGTVQALAVSAGYHDFVRRGTGVIARDFGHDAYRVDVDGRIDQGASWQLPVYLAHALHRRGMLGDGTPAAGDRVIWATGEVDIDLGVRPVAGVAEKLAHSLEAIRAWRAQGIEVQVLLPSSNLGEGSAQIKSLAGVSGVNRMLDVSLDGDAVPSRFFANVDSWRWRWTLAAALLALVVGTLWVGCSERGYLDPSGETLDDFGSKERRLSRPG